VAPPPPPAADPAPAPAGQTNPDSAAIPPAGTP